MISHQAPSSTLAIELIAEWAAAFDLDFQGGPKLSGAVFSRCGLYRYLLWRRAMGPWPFQSLGMLNPSKAGAVVNDPTIVRGIGFTPQGFSGPLVWNLFAFRATDPKDLKAADEPIGPLNDSAIDLALRISGRSIAAWGTHGSYLGRDRQVLRRAGALEASLHVLKLTAGGHPGHPLYLPKVARPVPWEYEW